MPHRTFAKQVRTVMLWALIPIGLIAVPLTVILVVSLGTSNNTEDILAVQAQADRNLAVQVCTSQYAATFSAWDAEASRLFGQLIASSVASPDADPDTTIVEGYTTATSNAAELARRRLGLAAIASSETLNRDGRVFVCPTLPRRLRVSAQGPSNG